MNTLKQFIRLKRYKLVSWPSQYVKFRKRMYYLIEKVKSKVTLTNLVSYFQSNKQIIVKCAGVGDFKTSLCIPALRTGKQSKGAMYTKPTKYKKTTDKKTDRMLS